MLNKILGGVKDRFVEGFIREYVNGAYGDIVTINSVKLGKKNGVVSDMTIDLTLNGETKSDEVVIKGVKVNDNNGVLTLSAESVDATRPWMKALVDKVIEKLKLDSKFRDLFKGASFVVENV